MNINMILIIVLISIVISTIVSLTIMFLWIVVKPRKRNPLAIFIKGDKIILVNIMGVNGKTFSCVGRSGLKYITPKDKVIILTNKEDMNYIRNILRLRKGNGTVTYRIPMYVRNAKDMTVIKTSIVKSRIETKFY